MRYIILLFMSTFCLAGSDILKQGDEFSIYMLYTNADIVVKSVIYILVIFSFVSWGIVFAKSLQYFYGNKNIKKSLEMLKNVETIKDLPKFKDCDFANTLSKEIMDEISKSKNLSKIDSCIKLRLEIRVKAISLNIKKFTSILATISSSAPFIGLFGTVWGIMNSFIGIASSNNTTLEVVAPGIAEALFATAFGLWAAIPAVLFYNLLLNKNIIFINLLDEMATMLFVIASRTTNGDKND
ncbi:MAG: MotA/TolQ/ExbB proton channel family protein [Campylobacter sp.]|nr:MotA/TolQ/ExbB proton channel family protein [Campylobacter sp.]